MFGFDDCDSLHRSGSSQDVTLLTDVTSYACTFVALFLRTRAPQQIIFCLVVLLDMESIFQLFSDAAFSPRRAQAAEYHLGLHLYFGLL